MFDWVENRLLASRYEFEILSSLLLQIKQRKTLSWKIFVTPFLKKRKVVVGQ